MLTREQINALEPGLPADAAAAEAMGDKPVRECHEDWDDCPLDTGVRDCASCKQWKLNPPKPYSTNAFAMMEVVKRMEHDGYKVVMIQMPGGRYCRLYGKSSIGRWSEVLHAWGDTLELAVAKAFLLWELAKQGRKEAK